jgi:hypothetical protein
MLKLILLSICISLLICCAKPGTIQDPFKQYKDRIEQLESDLADANNTTEHYKEVTRLKQEEMDKTYEQDNLIYGRFDTCSSLMGEMFGFVHNKKNLSDIDKKRLHFIMVLRDNTFDYTDATENYKPEYQTESGGDGEDDYEESDDVQ